MTAQSLNHGGQGLNSNEANKTASRSGDECACEYTQPRSGTCVRARPFLRIEHSEIEINIHDESHRSDK